MDVLQLRLRAEESPGFQILGMGRQVSLPDVN